MKKHYCSEAFGLGFFWARGLGLPGRAREANFIPVSITKAPLVREWRHLSAAGLASPRLTSYELSRMEARSGEPEPPAAYAILPGSAGLVVVDADDPAMVPALIRLYGDTPVRTQTPSGGTHLYYLAPEDPDAPGGRAHVVSRTGVRGPRSYDVKASGSMCHMPGGEAHRGPYTASLPPCEWEAGELRAMLPVFPVARYEADWRAHHPEAEWEPQGDRVDDFVLPTDWLGAADLWAEAIEAFGPAREGERHSKGRRLALQLGDRGCPQEEALVLMLAWNRTCLPPEEEARVRALVVDAYRTRRSALGCRVPEAMLRAAGATEPGDPDDSATDGPAEVEDAQDGAWSAEGGGTEKPAPATPTVPPGLLEELGRLKLAEERGARKDRTSAKPINPEKVHALRRLLTKAEEGGGALVAPATDLGRALATANLCYWRGLSSVEAAAELEGLFGDRLSSTEIAAALLWVYVDRAAADPELGTLAASRIEIPATVFEGAPWFARYARTAVEPILLHEDASLLTGLGMFAAALRDQVLVETRNPNGTVWRMPPVMYVVIEVPSGGGKSVLVDAWGMPAFSKYADPGGYLSQCEYAQAVRSFKRAREDAAAQWARTQRSASPRPPRESASEGAKARNAHNAQLNRALVQMAQKPAILEAPIPTVPRMLLDDITPERFVQVARLAGFVAVLTTEGKKALEKFLRGRDGGEQTDVLLTAYSRDTYRRERVSEADDLGEKVQPLTRVKFCATMLLMLQCGVLSPTSEDEGKMLGTIARRGLLARCLIGRPPLLTAAQTVERNRRMDDLAARMEAGEFDVTAAAERMALHALMRHILCEVPRIPPEVAVLREGCGVEPAHPGTAIWPTHPTSPPGDPPHDGRWRAVLSLAASRRAWKIKGRLAERHAPGGDLSGEMVAELARRLQEHVVRLAVVLRYMRAATPAWESALEQARKYLEAGGEAHDGWVAPVPLPPVLSDIEVDVEDVERARAFAEDYILEQARLVYHRAVYAPTEDDADRLAAWLAEQPDGAATRAQIVRAEPFARGWLEPVRGSKSRLQLAIGVLLARGQVRREATTSGDERYVLARQGAPQVD